MEVSPFFSHTLPYIASVDPGRPEPTDPYTKESPKSYSETRAGRDGECVVADGRFFVDENFILQHPERGTVGFANGGVDTNNSQFYITLAPMPHLNGRFVSFGELIIQYLFTLTEPLFLLRANC